MYRNTFRHALANTLVASVVNYTVWFAVTFWVYLETHSVFATGVIAGIFLTFTALSGMWFGSFVDHHGKRTVMIVSSAASLVSYALAFAGFRLAGPEPFGDAGSPALWAFVLLLMVGVIAGNLRGHRHVHAGHAARPGGPAGQGERAGRHRVRRVVPDHVGAQRAAGGAVRACTAVPAVARR